MSANKQAFTLENTPLVDKTHKNEQKWKVKKQQIEALIKAGIKRTASVPAIAKKRAEFKRKMENEDPLNEKKDITYGHTRPDFR